MSLDPGTAALYTDFSDFDRLRAGARDEVSPETLREVARQFESIFIQMMLKNMRAASFGDELFDSDQGAHYREMFDGQIALQMGRQGGFGLADLLVRQLGGDVDPVPSAQARSSTPGAAEAMPAARVAAIASPAEFVRELRPHAVDAAARLGVDPEVLLAQAALETGWGSRMIAGADGGNSHNLFGIKADRRWTGERAPAVTVEYEDGIAVKRREAFRAYDSFAAGFADYADFLLGNPRYARALEHGGDARRFVEGLQAAGYATDPDYASRILRILDDGLPAGAA